MELLLFLPLLLVGGLVFGGGSDTDDASDGDDAPADAAEESQTGTSGADILLGGEGADLIDGLEGNDILSGEAGPDSLTGGAGNDILLGGAGDDVLSGGTGRDILIGGAGDDLLNGGFGADLLIGSSGSDTLMGGEGNDTLIGVEYDLIAEELADVADEITEVVASTTDDPAAGQLAARIAGAAGSGDVAERGPDLLEGGGGDDLLIGDDGDTMTGGAGTDEFGVVFTSGDDASLVTDFDHQTETLTLVLDNPDAATILIRADGPENSVVLVDGEVVVRLTGQSAADLSADTSSWLFLEPL
ncbi:calcium-binding protein [Pseudotabrizicola sp. 4114]|uniref:calcium-binding protein n=1 Tax=Pseudotabrizicola sp. 4114 TaxID=2817731 RepID=UPI00286686F9|nr:Ca2+-binding RTX toxin-like protein [Pseudorhodobacter sp. 4114]